MPTDAETGMAWWNATTVEERSRWMRAAGDTGVVADAWEAFKSGAQEGSAAFSACPWCGLRGPGFDESLRPLDYCSHADPGIC